LFGEVDGDDVVFAGDHSEHSFHITPSSREQVHLKSLSCIGCYRGKGCLSTMRDFSHLTTPLSPPLIHGYAACSLYIQTARHTHSLDLDTSIHDG
jgi:hypothetical protein